MAYCKSALGLKCCPSFCTPIMQTHTTVTATLHEYYTQMYWTRKCDKK